MSRQRKNSIKEAMGYDPEPPINICATCRFVEERSTRKLWCTWPSVHFRVKQDATCKRWVHGEERAA